MPGPTSYRDVDFVTVIPSVTVNATIPRGARVVPYPADGSNYVALAGATARGSFILETSGAPGFPVPAAPIGKGGDFFAIVAAGVTVANGDTLYAAANGQVTNVAGGGAPIIGIAREAGVAGGLVGLTLQGIL